MAARRPAAFPEMAAAPAVPVAWDRPERRPPSLLPGAGGWRRAPALVSTTSTSTSTSTTWFSLSSPNLVGHGLRRPATFELNDDVLRIAQLLIDFQRLVWAVELVAIDLL